MSGGFRANTRRREQELYTFARPSGGGSQSWNLPHVGLLKGLWLNITGSISGTLSALNTYGKSVIVRSVSLTANDGFKVFSYSGVGYHWIIRDQLDLRPVDPLGFTDARSVVATGAFDVSMYCPLMLNSRDEIGLILLAANGSEFRLDLNWESDGNIATGITAITANCVVTAEWFTVPMDRGDWPQSLQVAHCITEDSTTIGGTGEFQYDWPRGNVYLGLYHGFGFGASGAADHFDKVQWVSDRQDFVESYAPSHLDQEFYYYRGRARPKGVIPYDYMGSSGLGDYGLMRDVLDSSRFTDIQSRFNVTGSPPYTLYSIRRQLMPIKQG